MIKQCKKCNSNLEIKRHKILTVKMLKQNYFFTEWGYCNNCGFQQNFNDRKVIIEKDTPKLLHSN